MQISLDTNELSDTDKAVLAVLAGTCCNTDKKVDTAAVGEPKVSAKKAKPAKTTKDPEPEDEAPVMADAVARATELVSGGEANKVKAALADLGVKRVSELKGDQIATFLADLG